MKALFEIVLLASLVASAISFQSGKEYHYKFEAYSYAKIKNTKPQYAGTASIADMVLQVKDDTFTFKFTNSRLDTVNVKIDGPFEKYPFEFKEVPPFTEATSKPFKAVIQNGHVKQFYISDEEPDWSINLKKGFLNVFELDIYHDAHHDSSSHAHIHPDIDTYTVSEKSSNGECDTSYSVKSGIGASGQEVMNVTKIRNNDKCTKRPHTYSYQSWVGIPCDDCEHSARRDVLQTASVYDYNLRKDDKDHYTIERLKHSELITNSPFGKDGQTIDLRARRVLELVQVKDITEEITLTGNIEPESDFTVIPFKKSEFFDNIDLKKAHYLHDIFLYQAPVTQIVGQLDEIIDEYPTADASVEQSSLPAKFGELVDGISTLNYDEIEQVHKGVWEKSDNHKKLFLDALASAGTNPAFLFAKYLIENKKLTEKFSKHTLLHKLAYSIKEPTEALFNEYLTLCSSDAAKECKKFKQACYLTFSSLVAKECVMKYIVHHAMKTHQHHHHKVTSKIADHSKHHCTPEVAEKYFKLLVKPEETEIDEHELILRLKTASNFKIKAAFPYLSKYLGKDKEHHLRASAAWNMVGAAKLNGKDAKEVGLGLLFDRNEEQDIRIAGYVMWFMGQPTLTELQLVAKFLVTEPNRQVVNYIYTWLKESSEAKLPCMSKFARDIRVTLWVFKIAFDRFGGKLQMWDSRTHLHTRLDPIFKIGGASHFSMIASNRSYIPSSIFMGSYSSIAGVLYSDISVHITTYGLDKVINRLVGRKGVYWKKTSIFDIFKKRTTRDASAVDIEIKKYEKALPIETRDFEELHGEVTVMVGGSQIGYKHFDEKLFASFLKDGSISIPDITKALDINFGGYEKTGFIQPMEYLWALHDEIGIPYIFRIKAASKIKFENQKIKFNVAPAFFVEDRDNKPPSVASVTADLKYTNQVDMYRTGGHLFPLARQIVGVGWHKKVVRSIPLNGELSYKYSEKQITLKRTPKTMTLAYLKVTPFTFIDHYSNKIPLHLEAEFKPIYNDKELKKVDRSYFKNYLGFELRGELSALDSAMDKGEIYKFYKEKSFLERLDHYKYSPRGIPMELRISSRPAEQNPTTEFKASLSWKKEEKSDESEVSDFSYNEDAFFKEYTSRADRKPETHLLKLEIIGEGDLQRSILAEMKYTHSRDGLVHRINFNYDRAPVNDNGYKVCAVSSMVFPDYDMTKFTKLETLDLDHTVNFTGKVAFGENCVSNAVIKMKAQLSQSDEQKRLERSRETIDPESPNPYAMKYLFCKNKSPLKWDVFPYCPRYLMSITEMRKVQAEIEYEKLPQKFVNMTYSFMRKNGQKYLAYSDPFFNPNGRPEGKIKYESSSSVIKPTYSLRVEAPHFTQQMKDVPYPKNIPPVSTFPLYGYKYWHSLRGVVSPRYPYCIVQGKFVRTFDNASFALPAIDSKCEIVLAKDCSPEHNFLLLGSKGEEKTNLKLFLSHKFKLEMLSGEDGVKVQLNGKPVAVKKTEPFIYKMKFGTKEVELFSVTFNGASYDIDASKFGIRVATDGNGVVVGVHKYYSGKACGICGDLNGNAGDDYRTSKGQVVTSSNEFVGSFIIPDPMCTPQLLPIGVENDVA